MIPALVAALAHSTILIVDKIILSRERVAIRVFLPTLFILLFAFTFMATPFLGRIDWGLATLPNALFLLFAMLLLAVGWNVFYYQSLQKDSVTHHEMIQMSGPLVTVILAAIFYPTDFDFRIFILALIASLALLFARSRREHFLPTQASYNAMLGVVMMAAESVVIAELLHYYSPVALYAIRTFILALFFYAYFRPRLEKISQRHWLFLGLSAFIGASMMIARFYAFAEVGLIFTTMVLVIAPILVFFFSKEFLHEKIRPRLIVAAATVVICVVIATVILR